MIFIAAFVFFLAVAGLAALFLDKIGKATAPKLPASMEKYFLADGESFESIAAGTVPIDETARRRQHRALVACLLFSGAAFLCFAAVAAIVAAAVALFLSKGL